jgi:hypothetical protein
LSRIARSPSYRLRQSRSSAPQFPRKSSRALVDRAGGQGSGDGLAPGLERGQDVRAALALYRVNPAHLVDQPVAHPAAPQLTDNLGARLRQRCAAAGSQLQPAPGLLGKPAGVNEQRPGEGGDRVMSKEVPSVQRLGDRADRRRTRPARLLAAAQPPAGAQMQDSMHIGQRLLLGEPDGVSALGRLAHVRKP